MKPKNLTVDLYDKTIMASSRDVMLSICSPLMKQFEVSYVNYIKLFEDNTQITITTHPDWVEHFFKQKYYRNVVCEALTEFKGSHEVLLWSSYQENIDIRHDERELFNFGRGITLISEHETYKEYFHLATQPDRDAIEKLFVYGFDVFNHFTCYFKDQAAAFIKKAEKERIVRV